MLFGLVLVNPHARVDIPCCAHAPTHAPIPISFTKCHSRPPCLSRLRPDPFRLVNPGM